MPSKRKPRCKWCNDTGYVSHFLGTLKCGMCFAAPLSAHQRKVSEAFRKASKKLEVRDAST